jgi:hypothetical protein
MSRPGIEPGPPAWEASTLEKSHLDSLSAGYSEPLLGRHLLTTFGPLQHQRCAVIGIPPLVCAHLQLCRKSRLFLKIVLI